MQYRQPKVGEHVWVAYPFSMIWREGKVLVAPTPPQQSYFRISFGDEARLFLREEILTEEEHALECLKTI